MVSEPLGLRSLIKDSEPFFVLRKFIHCLFGSPLRSDQFVFTTTIVGHKRIPAGKTISNDWLGSRWASRARETFAGENTAVAHGGAWDGGFQPTLPLRHCIVNSSKILWCFWSKDHWLLRNIRVTSVLPFLLSSSWIYYSSSLLWLLLVHLSLNSSCLGWWVC